MNKVFAVGVGPGSPKYVTDIVKEAISQCDVVIGYGYTIKTIEEYVKDKKILEVTMKNQEEAYQEIAKEDNHTILVPFTGDVNFSESEVVDRLIEIYDEVEIIPGISSTQVAASTAVTTIVTVSCVDINTLVDRAKVYPDLKQEERQEIIDLYYDFGDKFGLDCRDAKDD